MDKLISTEDLAQYLGVPVQTLYVWRTKGTGPRAVRVGKHLRYRHADVEAWLDSKAAAAGPSTPDVTA